MAFGSNRKASAAMQHREHINDPSRVSEDEVVGFVAELDELPKGPFKHDFTPFLDDC
jgi:hypothetical protein